MPEANMAQDTCRLALALSGGGFRATLFHLGVIRFLRDSGQLKNVKYISAVSGGSILAAHLVLNWGSYIGTDKEFEAATSKIIDFCQYDVRGRILRRCMLRRRTKLLQYYLSHELYGNAKLSCLEGSGNPSPPHLYILATSLTAGGYCWFDKSGFSLNRGIKGVRHFTPKSSLTVSFAVASSSAFPPLFPPVVLQRKKHLVVTQEGFKLKRMDLSDGGIFDNVGIHHFSQLEKDDRLRDIETLISSDASAKLDWDVDSCFAFMVPRAARATEILMQRVADLERERTSTKDGLKAKVLKIAIDDTVDNRDFLDPLTETLQKTAPQVRTDLDLFEDDEICTLIHHGYEVAYKMFESSRCKVTQVWTPWQKDHKQVELKNVDKRRLRLLSRQDWLVPASIGLGYAGLLLAILYITVVGLYTLSEKHFAKMTGMGIAEMPGMDKEVVSCEAINPNKDGPDAMEVRERIVESSGSNDQDSHKNRDYHKRSLARIDLSQRTLNRFNFWGSDMSGAHLEATRLEGADLGGVNLDHAYLKKATLDKAYIWRSNIEPPIRESSLKCTDLEEASLIQAILLDADLQHASLKKAILIGAYLIGADLTDASMEGAVLEHANLSGAILRRTTLTDANLKNANLTKADLSTAKGLTVGQVAAAMWNADPQLPPEISEHFMCSKRASPCLNGNQSRK